MYMNELERIFESERWIRERIEQRRESERLVREKDWRKRRISYIKTWERVNKEESIWIKKMMWEFPLNDY